MCSLILATEEMCVAIRTAWQVTTQLKVEAKGREWRFARPVARLVTRDLCKAYFVSRCVKEVVFKQLNRGPECQ